MERSTDSWHLTKQTWGVLMENRAMLLFPVVSAVVVLLVSGVLPRR